VSVDVQEYARVTCPALLKGPILTADVMRQFKELYDKNSHALRKIYTPMLGYESDANRAFVSGDPAPLADVREYGCMLQQYRDKVPSGLRSAMRKCDDARRKTEAICYDAALRHFGGTYFSYEQALSISAAARRWTSFPTNAGNSALTLMLSATSHCSSTVGGQFAQPLKAIDSAGNIKHAVIKKP
jgi:hypothetical protein